MLYLEWRFSLHDILWFAVLSGCHDDKAYVHRYLTTAKQNGGKSVYGNSNQVGSRLPGAHF